MKSSAQTLSPVGWADKRGNQLEISMFLDGFAQAAFGNLANALLVTIVEMTHETGAIDNRHCWHAGSSIEILGSLVF